MNDNNIDKVFENLKNQFDVDSPKSAHELRFQQKLETQNNSAAKVLKLKPSIWKPIFAIAASIVMLLAVFINLNGGDKKSDLASVSPEMAKTQDFFTASINEELRKLKAESSPEVQVLIQDALKRIQVLENDYAGLKIDLKESGEDNRVIYAMISNFQNRIDILQNTLEQIEIVKQLNYSSDGLLESNI
ncbi:hypothetical protein [Cognatitamlana onchidii]|uniref:hypothetical protein n=1 Tax=Cognatitamlana onchidii TaxID=2562860 RepID=UPI0010A60434|nr:hypothetical protein [Algibacter onchidii]